MLSLGALSFTTPLLLAGLVLLPAIWLLLRATPPSPQRQRFPALVLLRDLTAREETPAHMPWWLLAMRLALAGLVILALAGPLLGASRDTGSAGGPLLLVVDNGWAAGRDWDARLASLGDSVAAAERSGRAVRLLATEPGLADGRVAVSGEMSAAEAAQALAALHPQPLPADRSAAAEALAALPDLARMDAVWVSDGLDDPGARAMTDALAAAASVRLLLPDSAALPLLLKEVRAEPERLTVTASRAAPGPALTRFLRASADDGRQLAREPLAFKENETVGTAVLTLPQELRNRLAGVAIEGESTAGAMLLLDERWRRRPVGLVGAQDVDTRQLLSDNFYIERALAPFSEIETGSVEELLRKQVAVIVLADVAGLTDSEIAALNDWMKTGGVLLRFAGPHLAANPDSLVPVALRKGDRMLGGAMSWSKPVALGSFSATGPLHDMTVPTDVEVRRQVLAEPALDLPEKTWATLADGTPLITAEARGQGRLVLVHTTAGPDWNSLALSGAFVEMLRHVVALSQGVGGAATAAANAALAPVQVLDGQGRLGSPPAEALPVRPADYPAAGDGTRSLGDAAFARQVLSPAHPPGFYGSEDTRQALNLPGAVASLAPLPVAGLPGSFALGRFDGSGETNLMPWLLGAAVLLFLIDMAVGLGLRGLLRMPAAVRIAAPAALLLAAALAFLPGQPARAQDAAADATAQKAALGNYLAYIATGDAEADRTSRAGLEGLAQVLGDRSSVEIAGVQAVDPDSDELAFFPLLYWPMTAGQSDLSDRAIARLNEYMRNGGLIIFDTRDGPLAGTGMGNGPGSDALRRVVAKLDIPSLQPVPQDHVLTRAFYLLQNFPGRYDGTQTWVEARQGGGNDGVTAVIIGHNDWAGAWARDASGRTLYAVSPGGEQQREYAYRFGVNAVMVALTGNYKADQVHVPAILERIGQ